ncbi:hypothetical protein [Mucilaginibacter xinganensis]|uniref:Uncharacterized protein n=1 Tax=Mucilaginibacter xinganensis TaxID=1234841 RepID=A0A223NXR4_9SPHI|nr:hypothetical protein [Mucilaginibacter xinganensis]ASU34669.1 hypothetical protein MuYL_2782 [Mucilaginibacter xinganensis]
MNYLKFLLIIALMTLSLHLNAQTLYVDALKGKGVAKGTQTDPLLSIEKAVTIVNTFSSNEPVTIKLSPDQPATNCISASLSINNHE